MWIRSTRTKEILAAALLFLSIGLIEFWPAFTGKIPLPTDLVLQFQAFQANPLAYGADPSSHSEMGDIVTQVYPWRAYARTSLRHGEIPLWNPYILAGTPFQMNGQSALFYPPNWIFHVLPMPIAWAVSLVLKIILIGSFTFLFARAIGCSNLAAMGSGVVLVMSGYFWCWMPWPTVDAALWLPLMCYAVHRLYRTGRGVILVGISFAMPVLAGQPEIAFYVVCAAMLFAFFLCANVVDSAGGTHISIRKFLIRLSTAGFISGGLAAVQLFPTLEWLQLTYRSFSTLWGPLNIKQALALFSRDLSHDPNISGIRIPVEAAYVGGMTLIAAPLAWFFPSRRLAIWFIAILLFSFAGVYGIEPIGSLSLALPIFQSAKKEPMLLIMAFALALLCGMGLTALQENAPARKRVILLPALFVSIVALIGTLFLGRGVVRTDWFRVPDSIIPFLITALLLVGLRATGKLSGRRFALGALILLIVDLGSYAYGYLPFVRPNTIYPSAPVFDFLRGQSPPFRVLSLDQCVGPNFESMYELPAPGGYDIMLRRITRLTWDLTAAEKDKLIFEAERLRGISHRVLDMLNVKYVLAATTSKGSEWLLSRPNQFEQVFSDGNVSVFENRRFIEFGIVVPQEGMETLRDEEAQLARVTSAAFDPYRQVVLSQAPAKPMLALLAADGEKSRMTSFQRRANSFSLGIDTSYEGILVASEMHFPGWHVYVDGVEQQLLRANYAFMGVAVKPGIHEVRFDFHPAVFCWGLEISMITIGVMVIVAFSRRNIFPAGIRRGAPIAAMAAAAFLMAGFTLRFVYLKSKETLGENMPDAKPTLNDKIRTGYFIVANESGKFPHVRVSMDYRKEEHAHLDVRILPRTTHASASIEGIPWNEIGIAIANPGDSDNSIILEISTKGGEHQVSTVKLLPGHQSSKFLAEVFPDLQIGAPATLSLLGPNPFSVFMAQFAGANMQSIPVEIREPQPGSLLFPQLVSGGGWSTEIFLTNSEAEVAIGQVELFDPEHLPFILESQGVRQNTIKYSIPPGKTLRISPDEF